MDGRRTALQIRRGPLRRGLAIAVLAALTVLLAAMRPAFAAADAPSAADQRCLGCHGSAGMEKRLEDGGTLPLHVPAEIFAKSVHGPLGCAGCHAEVDPAAHPPAKNDIASARSFSVAMTQVCRNCHTDKFDQWEGSIHAALARMGNPAAPLCTGCHNPHAVIKNRAAEIDQVPCQKCHTEIYNAYLGSVHAQARRSSDQSFAPICFDCHSAHEVKPTALGEGPKVACLGCHAGALEGHQKWLPNAALHFEVVSCPACHASNVQRKVDLMLIDSKDAQPLGTEQIGVPLFNASAQSDSKGIDAATLWNLLQTLNRAGAGKIVLRGRLDVRDGAQAHQLADKKKALSECSTCHSAKSQAFDSVTISLVGPEGRRVDYGANADVLNSAISLGSLTGFYAIGGTRIGFLDILLILAIVSSLAVPIGHLTLGWIFRRYFLVQPQTGSGHGGAGGGPKAT